MIDSVGYFQLFMESKRLQNPPAFSEIDAVLNDIYRKDMSYNDNISVSSDEALQELVQDDGYMSIMNSSEAVQNIIDVLKNVIAADIKNILKHSSFMPKVSRANRIFIRHINMMRDTLKVSK